MDGMGGGSEVFRKMKSIACLTLAASIALSCGGSANAAVKAGDGVKAVTEFLDKHCTGCHDAAEKKGGLDL